ncbi:MAG TPA: hypothetical protein VF525_14915 [Pyrinomonadaceae bacterium]|jgi:hypothetical protein
MTNPLRILLQTTIPHAADDWHIGRFSLLSAHLAALRTEAGQPLCLVTARDREADAAGDDPLLSRLDESEFDELWLFAVDAGAGLSERDCAGITRFRQRGGGLLVTRDHQDLGASVCTLGGVGRAHYFHTHNPDPDPARWCRDDQATTAINWPNYHSGSNGDYQRIHAALPAHPLMLRSERPGDVLEFFPAHPHEGAVGVPPDERHARVIATGESKVSGRSFNLIVAFERASDEQGHTLGRAIAESSIHHLLDYNWDTRAGCPSFLTEPPGDEIARDPARLADIKTYVANAARWLAPQSA